MLDTRIKICGITTPEDAEAAAVLGVDYLGLIFVESSRRVSFEQAAKIRNAVPDAMLVGVFMDTPLDEVVGTARDARVNMVQLHGNESPAYCDALLERLGLPVIKSFTRARLANNSLHEYRRTSYFHVDLDKNTTGNGGATDNQVRLWAEATALRNKGYRIFLAGALTPHNVRQAVQRVQPYCVDVASSVEASPGIKDHERMRQFVTEVRR